MAAKHVWFDPSTGNASESEHAKWWRVICDDGAVSILGRKSKLIGSGKWTGKSIKQRYVLDEPISDSQWAKLENALKKSFNGTLDTAGEDTPLRRAAPQLPVARGVHAVVHLQNGLLTYGTQTSNDQVHVAVEGDRVTITDDDGQVATAQFDGKFLGKREPGASVLNGNAAAWNMVEGAVIALASGTRPRPPEPEGYIEATVQLMSGEIVDKSTTPSTAAIDNMFHARVALDASRVTITDHVGTATARWDGSALVDRDDGDSTLSANAAMWTSIEQAVATIAKERPASTPAVRVSSVAHENQPAPSVGTRETRSGWWALGAMVVAIGGAIVAWMSNRPGDTVGLVIAIALTVLAVGLVIYTVYGATTRCPGCKAWYRRETTSVEDLGTSQVTRHESKPVYDSSGKQTGTTSEWVTYNVTNYRYHYRCKECSHRWTGHGSSESRA